METHERASFKALDIHSMTEDYETHFSVILLILGISIKMCIC